MKDDKINSRIKEEVNEEGESHYEKSYYDFLDMPKGERTQLINRRRQKTETSTNGCPSDVDSFKNPTFEKEDYPRRQWKSKTESGGELNYKN